MNTNSFIDYLYETRNKRDLNLESFYFFCDTLNFDNLKKFNDNNYHILDKNIDGSIYTSLLFFFKNIYERQESILLNLSFEIIDNYNINYILFKDIKTYNDTKKTLFTLFIIFLGVYNEFGEFDCIGEEQEYNHLMTCLFKNLYDELAKLYPRYMLTKKDLKNIKSRNIERELYQNFHDNMDICNIFPFVENNVMDILKKKKILLKSSSFQNVIENIGYDQFSTLYNIYGEITCNLPLLEEKTNYTSDMFEKYLYENFNTLEEREKMPEFFKKKYPKLFVDNPKLQNLLFDDLKEFKAKEFIGHPEYKEMLLTKNLEKILYKLNKEADGKYNNLYKKLSLYFTNEEILDFMSSYNRLWDKTNFNIKGNTKEEITKSILDSLLQTYISTGNDLLTNIPKQLRDYAPDLFIDDDAPNELKEAFNLKHINAHCIYKHPDYIPYLENKNPIIYLSKYNSCIYKNYEILKEKSNITTKDFLNLSFIYQDLLDLFQFPIEGIDNRKITYEEVIKEYNKIVISYDIPYAKPFYYLKGAMQRDYPEYFLSDSAPDALKQKFYHSKDTFLTFAHFKFNPEWIDYLKDKKLEIGFMRFDIRDNINLLIEKLGKETFFEILKKYPIVLHDLSNSIDDFDIVVDWYNKCGFLPNAIVIKNYPFEKVDNFLASSKKWSKITKLMLGLSFSDEYFLDILNICSVFGVFDFDDRGFNKVIDLFFSLNKSLDSNQYDKLNSDLKSKDLLPKLYIKNKDGKYILNNKYNQYNEEYITLRERLQDLDEYENDIKYNLNLIHQMFDGMDMTYKPDFREFFLKYEDDFIKNPTYVSLIERQFEEIKQFNANRTLTFERAISYVKNHIYENIEVGNYDLADYACKVGFSDKDFNRLQNIYNFTKKRIVSNIPRIKGNFNNYSYEILRLDDPLQLVIGNLTDCCQKLYGAGESSMFHSVFSENGRVFVIRNKSNEIIAQSWLWRKEDLICFDNIEISDKAYSKVNDSKIFAKEIYDVYKEVSKKIIDIDKTISQITVGLGYNDIKEIIKEQSKEVENSIYLDKYYNCLDDEFQKLYTDAKVQYILEVNKNFKEINYEEEIPTFYDDFAVYDNLSIEQFRYLRKLKSINNADYLKENNNLKILMNYNMAIIYENDFEDKKVLDILFNNKDSKITCYQIKKGLEQLENNNIYPNEELKNKLKIIRKENV